MALKTFKPVTPSLRQLVLVDRRDPSDEPAGRDDGLRRLEPGVPARVDLDAPGVTGRRRGRERDDARCHDVAS